MPVTYLFRPLGRFVIYPLFAKEVVISQYHISLFTSLLTIKCNIVIIKIIIICSYRLSLVIIIIIVNFCNHHCPLPTYNPWFYYLLFSDIYLSIFIIGYYCHHYHSSLHPQSSFPYQFLLLIINIQQYSQCKLLL